MALFPHQKLDWTINTLQEKLSRNPGDPGYRVEKARAQLSSGLFHRGGERACSQASKSASSCARVLSMRRAV